MARTDTTLIAVAESQRAIAETQRELTKAVDRLAASQEELIAVQSAQLAQQTATNLIVRAQTATDPDEKARLMGEARALMESRRAARHRRDLLAPRTFPDHI